MVIDREKLTAQNRDAYDSIAGLFSSTRDYLWDDLKPLREYTKDGDRVLDLGCGNGRLYQLFDGLSIDYTGLDQSEKLIEQAKEKFSESNTRSFLVGEMTTLEFEDDSFDVIYCIASFHHLMDTQQQQKALSSMNRILRPGGMIIMTNWNRYNDWVQNKINQKKYTVVDDEHVVVPWRNGPGDILAERHYYSFTLIGLETLFSDAGLALLDQYFVKKGNKVDISLGENIVSIVQKPL